MAGPMYPQFNYQRKGVVGRNLLRSVAKASGLPQMASDAYWSATHPIDRITGKGRAANPRMEMPWGPSAAMALAVPGKVVPLGGGRQLIRASRVGDAGLDAEKNMRRIMVDDLVSQGVPRRQAAKEARNEIGVRVKYNLHEGNSPLPVAKSEYHIHPDRVWIDMILARNKDIRNARDLFRMPFEALEGQKRTLEGIVAHKSGDRMPDLIRAIARRQGKNIRLGPR